MLLEAGSTSNSSSRGPLRGQALRGELAAVLLLVVAVVVQMLVLLSTRVCQAVAICTSSLNT
jgi:hypothetical protein